jgi:SAM-dependent methyltransferase
MWLYLQRETTFFSAANLKVLHIAPEQCFLPHFKKQKNLDYITADLVSPIADIHFDLHDIPLEDKQYDVVFCNHVMEHVDDPIRCMSELQRVMKPGGWAIMQVPQDVTRKETYEDGVSRVLPKEKSIFGKKTMCVFLGWIIRNGLKEQVLK